MAMPPSTRSVRSHPPARIGYGKRLGWRRILLAVFTAGWAWCAAPDGHAADKHSLAQVKVKVNGAGKGKGKTRSKAKVKVKSKGRAKAKVKLAPLPVTNGKAAVFTFKGESSEAVQRQVVHLLRAKGMEVMTALRPVDSAVQYRDMAAALGLAVYVHGQVTDNGQQAKATVHIRSGVTGRKIASLKFSGESRKLPGDVAETLWEKVDYALGRACADAAKPRRTSAPLRIEAGTPIENTPSPTSAVDEGTAAHEGT